MREVIPEYCTQAPMLGLGTLPMAGAYGSMGTADAVAVISAALELGVKFIDTADAYGDGLAESIVGQAIAGRQDEVVVATKVGLVEGGRGGVRNDRSYIRSAVRASLSRLGIERLGLLFLHRIDPKMPIEETIEVLAELVREGVVAGIGLSEATASEIERAVTVHPIVAVQSEWSVWSRDVERAVVPACARESIVFIASSPLGRGFLAGRTTAPLPGDDRGRVPRFSDSHRVSNLAVARELARIARRQGITPAQLALVWLRHSGKRSGVPLLPIPGARSIAQLEENILSAKQYESAEVLDALDDLVYMVSGDRGNPDWLSYGRE